MQFLYLLLSLILGRKNPLFYLIFPMALVSGPGAFIDPRTVLIGNDIFIIGSNMYKDVIIFYLIAVAISLSTRFKIKPFFKTPILQYGFYILLLIILTLTSSGTDYGGLSMMRLFLYMVMGFFLLLIIFSTASYVQFISFFNMLFWATAVLSVFYVLNSSKVVPVFYQESLYSEIETGNSSFFRDFATMPYFSNLLFILAFTDNLLKTKIFNSKASRFLLVVYPFVLLYTFTRSLLLATILSCLVVVAIVAVKKSIFFFNKKIIAVLILGSVIFFVLQSKFGDELAYFTERINSAKTEGANEENVLIRAAYLSKSYDIVSGQSVLFTGVGLNRQHDDKMNYIGAWQADSTLPFLLIYTGVVGVLFYLFLGIYFMFKSLSQIKKYFNPISIAIFASIAISFLFSLMMGGIRWGDPFIFFPYVLIITVETLLKKNSKKKQLRFTDTRKFMLRR
jgi:hypothetical protein